MAHDEDQTRKEAVEEGKSQTEENNQLKGEEAAGSHSIWYLLNPFKGNQSEQQKKLKEAEDELEDLSAEVQTLRDEQKKSEDEKQQLLKKLKEAQEEVNRRWKEVNDIRKESKTQLEEKNAEISTLKRELEKQIWKEKQNVEKLEKELNELLTMDTQRKFQEEKTKRMKAEKEVETLKKQLKTKLDGSKSEDVDHQIKSRQQSSRSSDHHGDLRDIILENIDQHCKSVRLKNTSMEEKLLGGCKLELHINNKELFTYTFDTSIKVKAEGKITLWRPGFGLGHAPSGDWVWKDLKPWNPKDHFMFRLISKTGETKVLSLSD